MENIVKVLKAAGATLNDVVKVNIYLSNLSRDFVPMNEVYAQVRLHLGCTLKCSDDRNLQFFQPGQFPARTCIGVAALPVNADVEIECIAELPTDA
jgi:2-iminobutanoate/2-iminopropanoate deaminase